MEPLNSYLRNLLTKERILSNKVKWKNNTVTEAVKVPDNLKKIPLFDITFDKVEWDITEENIEKHREEIDTFGAVVVYATNEDEDFRSCVVADGDVADMLYDSIPFIQKYKSDKIEVFVSSDFKVYGTPKKYYELGQELGQALNEFTGAYEFTYDWNLNTDVIVRVKMGGHTDIFSIHQNGYYGDYWIPEKLFNELIKQRNKKAIPHSTNYKNG